MTHSSSLAMQRYSIEPTTRKFVKEYGFLSFARKHKNQLLDPGLDSLKTASKNVGEFLGNTITRAVTKSNDDKIMKQEPVQEIIILPGKRDEILNIMRKVS